MLPLFEVPVETASENSPHDKVSAESRIFASLNYRKKIISGDRQAGVSAIVIPNCGMSA
jgi:hypothetical protein